MPRPRLRAPASTCQAAATSVHGQADGRDDDPLGRRRPAGMAAGDDVRQLGRAGAVGRHEPRRHQPLGIAALVGRLVLPVVDDEQVGHRLEFERAVEARDEHDGRAGRDPLRGEARLDGHRGRDDRAGAAHGLRGRRHRARRRSGALAEAATPLRVGVVDAYLAQGRQDDAKRCQLGVREHARAEQAGDLGAGIREVAQGNAGHGTRAHGRDHRPVHHCQRQAGLPVGQEHERVGPRQAVPGRVVGNARDPLEPGHVELAADVGRHRHDPAVQLLGAGLVRPGDHHLRRHPHPAVRLDGEGPLDHVDHRRHVGAAGGDHVLLRQVQELGRPHPTNTTCTSPGPCTPRTRVCSMSAVRLGPVTSVTADARASSGPIRSSAAARSGTS